MDKYIRTDSSQADLLRTMPELLKDSMMVRAFSDYKGKAEEEIRNAFASRERLTALVEILHREDWRQMRAYLTVLKEYLPLLRFENQDIIMNFLTEMLLHQSGMVRRIAARTYGYLLAYRLEEYGVSPEEAVRKVLFPGPAISASERRKINYQLKYILLGFRERADESANKQLLNYYSGFFKSTRWDKATCFYLIMGIIDIPYEEWSNLQQYHIFSFLRNAQNDDNEELRLAALHLTSVWLEQGWSISEEIRQYLSGIGVGEDAKYCEKYLTDRIHELTDAARKDTEAFTDVETAKEKISLQQKEISLLFQENQHSHALWINKILNLSILKKYFYRLKEEGNTDHPYYFQYANHLINTLRLNKQAVVFLQAGEDLMEVMPDLQSYQKFEIVKDILQSLENVDDYYNFTAPYAGKAFLSLTPADQVELIPRLWELTDHQDPKIVNTCLEVVSEILADFYPHMQKQILEDPQSEGLLKKVDKNLCSVLSTGMASYKMPIAREAFFLTGHRVFGNIDRSGEIARPALLRLARKALISLKETNGHTNHFYNYSAIRRIHFTLEQNAELINAEEKPRKIAFFSGSFDPFTRGHKAIAREVAEMGYIVYIDAHDFSWYKKLQPKEIRRQIIYLSISDLENVLLFPEEYPISIENPEDLTFLRSLFPESEVTIVTGSDVIESCEAYWKEPEPGSVHSFPHIVFQRGIGISKDLVDPLLSEEAVFLRVPSYFDTMTSDEIQRQIALGRDISDMVDHQVKNYVYDNKLYRSEPIFKKIAKTRTVHFCSRQEADIGELKDLPWLPASTTDHEQWMFMEEPGSGGFKKTAAVSWHETSSRNLYEDCHSLAKTQLLRGLLSGKILVLTGIFQDGTSEDAMMIICNELFARYQKEEFAFAVCFSPDSSVLKILKCFGFIEAAGYEDCYYTDLRRPITIFYDTDSFIKEPYYTDVRVKSALGKARKRMQSVLPELYPGNLILHFYAPVINYRMIQMITEANQVPDHQVTPMEEDGAPASYEDFGESVCVLFGKLLKGVLIPNTITRELFIEKLYAGDLHTFDIQELPDYEPLRTQIRTLKAFRRPVIFADDLYHKGYRMEKISRVLEEEDVPLTKFIVGVLSGQGRDLSRENHLEVEAPYFIPDMRAWIVESDLYPFAGGDGIRPYGERREGVVGLPSTNMILPYQMPRFLQGAGLTEIYGLSKTAIINAREIFMALEEVYQKKNHQSLTFERIGEVVAEPRYPEGAVSERHNDHLVSELLSRELAKLKRLQSITLFEK